MYLDASRASIFDSKYTGISSNARLATYSRLVLPSSKLKCSALCLRDPTCAAYSFEKIDLMDDGECRLGSAGHVEEPRNGSKVYYKSTLRLSNIENLTEDQNKHL
jgi:hypothetical protein